MRYFLPFFALAVSLLGAASSLVGSRPEIGIVFTTVALFLIYFPTALGMFFILAKKAQQARGQAIIRAVALPLCGIIACYLVSFAVFLAAV